MREFFTSQYFKDHKGNLSMARLLVFLSFIVAAPVLLWLHTENAMTIFLSAFVINYAVGKTNETFDKRGKDANI